MKSQEVAANDQLIYIQRKRKTGDHEFHVVQPGENLYSIAQKEAVRMESLLEYNNLGSGMQPATGETLYLRSKSATAPKLAVTKNTVAENSPTNINSQSIAVNNVRSGQVSNSVSKNNVFFFHTVQPKETVYSIAKKYNVSFDDVVNWNQLQGFDLKIGQSLKIYK
jgi:LysM repeat protein